MTDLTNFMLERLWEDGDSLPLCAFTLLKVIWLNGQHTSEELGALFGISADAIPGQGVPRTLERAEQDKAP
jgi:hypothetical protein